MPKKRTITVFIFISLIVFSFFIQTSESGTIEDKPEMLTPQSKDDLQITLTANQTTIGKQGGALANLTLNNAGANPCGTITVDFTLDGEYLEFTPTYAEHQEIALLNPGSNSTLNIEVSVNESIAGPEETSADVCIIIDASGSMGGEIATVKAEILDLITELQASIPDLRMGVIVYGWSVYSEYPQESPNNYIEFTSDANAVSAFVNTLYASGGTEPWGDALYLASTWDWRDCAKLIVMIGDEDCDPGHVVGVGSTATYYNGSQLVDVVTNLKNMGVIINTIRCDTNAIFVNQFTWIAELTGGESVDLAEVLSGEFPGGIPQLIEYWTLELAREFYITIYADISWTELDPGGNVDYTDQRSLVITFDLAPPDISVTTYINPIAENDYTIEIYATIKDKSNLSSANIYWTDDDINGTPTWHFNMLTLIGNIYYFGLNHLVENQKISFYIQAADIVSNIAITDIFNETIVVTYIDVGATLDFVLIAENTTRVLLFDIDVSTEGYIWLKSEQPLNLDFGSNSDFLFEILYTDGYDSLHKITKISTVDKFSLTINGNTSLESITLHWNIMEILTEAELEDKTITLDEESPNYLLAVTWTEPESGYISMIMADYELNAVAHVFDSNWNYLGHVTATLALAISSGTYHIWIIKTLRTGGLQIRYDETPYTTTDPYYPTIATGFETLPLLLVLSLILGFLTIKRNSDKRRRKKLV